jgi:signal peptidase I
VTQAPRLPARSRIVAILVGLLGVGAGHFFVGQRRRAFAAYGAYLAIELGLMALFSPLADALGGVTAFALAAGVPALLWLASLVDVARIAPSRYEPLRLGPFLAFASAQYAIHFMTFVCTREWVLEAYKIPSASMFPSVTVGDRVLVDKRHFLRKQPTRGEVAVFAAPDHAEQSFDKRILALPGDTIKFVDDRPFINGWEVPHCRLGQGRMPDSTSIIAHSGDVELEFLHGRAYLVFYDRSGYSSGLTPSFKVSPGEYFVVGDNRRNSHDSRTWSTVRAAGVPRANLTGKPLFVYAGGEPGRFGAALEESRLPPSLSSLAPEFERCMKERPPSEKTFPPDAH